MFKIIDNFLNEGDHLILKTIMETNEFPWFYFNKKVSTDEGLFKSQFSHHFYRNNNINSEYFNYLKVEPKNLQEFKDNMYYLKVTEDIKKQRIRKSGTTEIQLIF